MLAKQIAMAELPACETQLACDVRGRKGLHVFRSLCPEDT